MTKDQAPISDNAPMSKSQLVLGICAALVIAGCGSNKTTTLNTTPPQPEERWSKSPLAVPPSPARPVQQAPAPLVYLVETAALVRVVDATSGEELLRVPVPAHTIVAVNASVGVQIGGATMKLGPLPADHQYAIYLESNEESITRQGIIRPGGRP